MADSSCGPAGSSRTPLPDDSFRQQNQFLGGALHAAPLVEERATPVREPCVLRSGRMSTAFDSSDEESEPVCRREPADWDVDAATPEKLRRSARACVYSCPLYALCKDVVASGAVKPRSMVWAGRAYDHNGDAFDLDQPGHKVGSRSERDTRIADTGGRVYDGHTGRWTPRPKRCNGGHR